VPPSEGDLHPVSRGPSQIVFAARTAQSLVLVQIQFL